MKNREIEIQVNVENIDSLVRFFKENAKLKSKVHQIDEYFSPPHRDFLKKRPVEEWLRLRNSNNKYYITYKRWHYIKNGEGYYCDEYETQVGSLAKLKKILKVLDFKPLVVVDKKRQTWMWKDYKISIDSVKDIGEFVEIEYIGKNKKRKPQEIIKEMINFLKKINCGKIKMNRVGYPFQLLFPEEVKYKEL
ncbi:class IV adenylate cyclase [bacterium]|nr:class IV adenylate cyclase [bacterium]